MYCRSSTPILLDQKPEAVRSRKLVKKRTPGFSSALPLAFSGPGDVVEHLRALAFARVHEGLAEAVLALEVEPGQPPAHRGLPILPVALRDEGIGHREVHELGHEGVAGAARALVLRDHEVGQEVHGGHSWALKNFGAKGTPFLAAAAAPFAACSCGLHGLSGREDQARHGRRADHLEEATPGDIGHERFPFLRSSAMYSLVRQARARMVQVTFLWALLTNEPAVGHEEVLRLVGLAVAVQDRGLRAVAHARGPDLVDDLAALRDAVVLVGPGHGIEHLAAHGRR